MDGFSEINDDDWSNSIEVIPQPNEDQDMNPSQTSVTNVGYRAEDSLNPNAASPTTNTTSPVDVPQTPSKTPFYTSRNLEEDTPSQRSRFILNMADIRAKKMAILLSTLVVVVAFLTVVMFQSNGSSGRPAPVQSSHDFNMGVNFGFHQPASVSMKRYQKEITQAFQEMQKNVEYSREELHKRIHDLESNSAEKNLVQLAFFVLFIAILSAVMFQLKTLNDKVAHRSSEALLTIVSEIKAKISDLETFSTNQNLTVAELQKKVSEFKKECLEFTRSQSQCINERVSGVKLDCMQFTKDQNKVIDGKVSDMKSDCMEFTKNQNQVTNERVSAFKTDCMEFTKDQNQAIKGLVSAVKTDCIDFTKDQSQVVQEKVSALKTECMEFTKDQSQVVQEKVSALKTECMEFTKDQRRVVQEKAEENDSRLDEFMKTQTEENNSRLDEFMKTQITDLKTECIDFTKDQCQVINERDAFMSAFSAGYKTTNALVLNSVLIFSNIYLKIGDGYNETTGLFTAPRSGYYMFHLVVMANYNINVQIVVNNKEVTTAYIQGSNYEQTSVNTVATLQKGEVVKPVVNGTGGTALYGNPLYSEFTGFLIKAL